MKYADPAPGRCVQIGQKSDRVGNASGLTPKIWILASLFPKHKSGDYHVFGPQAGCEEKHTERIIQILSSVNKRDGRC